MVCVLENMYMLSFMRDATTTEFNKFKQEPRIHNIFHQYPDNDVFVLYIHKHCKHNQLTFISNQTTCSIFQDSSHLCELQLYSSFCLNSSINSSRSVVDTNFFPLIY